MVDSLKYFELVIQLLELEINNDDYLEIAKYIEENSKKNYVFLHRHAFLFQAYLDLIGWKIDVETFVKTGDIESTTSLYKEDFAIEKLEWIKNSVVVLDRPVWNIYQNTTFDTLFIHNDVKLLVC